MNQQLLSDISKYVEEHIGEFHAARIAKLQTMNLKEILKRKNPYMYRAKNLVSASQLVESLAAATMSSAEESIFGNWMEGVAMFVAEKVYGTAPSLGIMLYHISDELAIEAFKSHGTPKHIHICAVVACESGID